MRLFVFFPLLFALPTTAKFPAKQFAFNFNIVSLLYFRFFTNGISFSRTRGTARACARGQTFLPPTLLDFPLSRCLHSYRSKIAQSSRLQLVFRNYILFSLQHFSPPPPPSAQTTARFVCSLK